MSLGIQNRRRKRPFRRRRALARIEHLRRKAKLHQPFAKPRRTCDALLKARRIGANGLVFQKLAPFIKNRLFHCSIALS